MHLDTQTFSVRQVIYAFPETMAIVLTIDACWEISLLSDSRPIIELDFFPRAELEGKKQAQLLVENLIKVIISKQSLIAVLLRFFI